MFFEQISGSTKECGAQSVPKAVYLSKQAMILARNTKVPQIAILNWMGGLHKIAIIENLKYEYHRNIDSTD